MDGSYCEVLTNLPHTWTFMSHDTKSLSVGVSLRVYSISKEYQMRGWCSSHIIGHHTPIVLFNVNLKWLATNQKYPKVHTILKICSCSYYFSKKGLYKNVCTHKVL
jgi:hypothetical protein